MGSHNRRLLSPHSIICYKRSQSATGSFTSTLPSRNEVTSCPYRIHFSVPGYIYPDDPSLIDVTTYYLTQPITHTLVAIFNPEPSLKTSSTTHNCNVVHTVKKTLRLLFHALHFRQLRHEQALKYPVRRRTFCQSSWLLSYNTSLTTEEARTSNPLSYYTSYATP